MCVGTASTHEVSSDKASVNTDNVKLCKHCNKLKELAYFRKYEKKNTISYSNKCKDCINASERESYRKKKENQSNSEIEVNVDSTKICTVCKVEKTLDNYHQAKNKGTIRAMCKECSSKKRKEYFKNNKDAVCTQTSNYKKQKIKSDIDFKITVRLRTRLYIALKSDGCSKSERTWKYIGCSPQMLRRWLEFQFYDGMNFENHGSLWHLEHVRPCASFDLSINENIHKCFSWKNVKPLLASKNLSKKDTVDNFQILLQELKVKVFLKQEGKVM